MTGTYVHTPSLFRFRRHAVPNRRESSKSESKSAFARQSAVVSSVTIFTRVRSARVLHAPPILLSPPPLSFRPFSLCFPRAVSCASIHSFLAQISFSYIARFSSKSPFSTIIQSLYIYTRIMIVFIADRLCYYVEERDSRYEVLLSNDTSGSFPYERNQGIPSKWKTWRIMERMDCR